jgi:formamidopyrimidine-DNA glycosylase
MPELPEVETVVRSVAPRICGQTITGIETSESRIFRGQQSELRQSLPGQRIAAVDRWGKNILVRLDRHTLRIHLGMTGKLLLPPARPTHPRATLVLDDTTLVFDDARQFGRFELLPDASESLLLGPDALSISLESFLSLLKQKRGAIKSVLMNQRILCGMGNIYTDEALFTARIHPLFPAYQVPRKKALALYEAMQALLREAIQAGGSSISDYVDASGTRGEYQDRHQVYGKEGAQCSRCGTAIQRIVVAQRGTHFCPRCQKTPASRAFAT